ncbi:hypothetical protein HDV00_011587 [Rhizophlyctis rosea]|nr:hypothetical protein HDV00_011587 [Rhizophlyctis rosea]
MTAPNISTIPEHITSTIAHFLFPDIKSTLRYALTNADNFAIIARDASLWRALYIQNEKVGPSFAHAGPWTITQCPELVKALNDPTYTDHSRKIGSGRMLRSVWFRCCMLMAMGMTTDVYCVWEFFERNPEEPCPSKGVSPNLVDDDVVSKIVEGGQWDSDVVPITDDGDIKISLEHSVAYCRYGDEAEEADEDFAKFIDQSGGPDCPNVGEDMKFGDWIECNEWRGQGKYYVTLASAVGGLQGKATYAVIDAPWGFSEYRAAPAEFAPPTFPFSYHMNDQTVGWLSAFCLKNGKGIRVFDGVHYCEIDDF